MLRKLIHRFGRRKARDPQVLVASKSAEFKMALEILPGTEYSKYAIPLDYLRSRDFKPRYGYTTGRIHQLEQLFSSRNEEYSFFIDYMKSLPLSHIPLRLAEGPLRPAWIGGPICAFDSLALYAMVCRHRPKVYLEIGSGMTTCFAKQAILDHGLDTKVVSIDPEPRREIDEICHEIIRDGLENCRLDIFDQLNPGDIVFFDGSHRSFMNSDVTVFFLDVLPRLKPGVVIHLHDIHLPWDYPEFFKNWYWNEQYLLAVYLMAAEAQVQPLLPTAWICRDPFFENKFISGFPDLGGCEANQSWRGGGSMWFTKKS